MPQKLKKQDIVDNIVKLRVEMGKSSRYILKEYLMDELGYKEVQAYYYYKIANEKIIKIYEQDQRKHAYTALSRMESLYDQAVAEGNKRLALDISKEIHKLTGVYAAEKVEIVDSHIRFKFETNEKKDEPETETE